MKARNLVTCLLVIAVALLVGCKKATEQVPTPDVEIAAAGDDGPVCIYRDSMPAIVGFAYGTSSTGIVGVTDDVGPAFIWRSFYRFDLSSWTTGDADFWLYCFSVIGTAHGLEFVAVDDFDSVPNQMLSRGDMSRLWGLVEAGQSLGSFTPDDTGWVHIAVPAARLEAAKAATGWLAIAVKAATEAIVPGNALHLATFEADPAVAPLPFLAW